MRTLPLALMIVLVITGAGLAQSKSGSIDLEYKNRSPALQPVPPNRLEEDTKQAVQELERRRTDEMLKKAEPTKPPRPDVDPDVTGGIQTRGLNDALRH